MEANAFSWLTDDGLKIHALHWPHEEPRAVIGFVHGMGEHAPRYHEIATAFQAAGFACLAYDRRGHGRSAGKRGHTPSYTAYLDEVGTLLDKMQTLYPDQARFLYGHSMGGNLVLSYLLSGAVQVAGIIASAPWIELSFKPSPLKVQGAKWIRALLPALSMKNELDPAHLSRDAQAVADYVNDPLVHDKITPNTGVFMLEKAAFLNEYSGKIHVPLLIIHGTDDQIIDFGAAKRFAERLDGPVTFKAWEGGYHELHHDTCKAEVINYTLQWLSAQL